MSSEWVDVTLGEITTWLSGGTPKKENSEFWGGTIPWISASSMQGTRYSTSDLKITSSGLNSGSRLAPKNAILLLVRGSALHSKIPVGIALNDVAFNQDVKALLADETKVTPWFLFYWLLSKRNYLLDNIVEFTGIGAGKLDTKRMQALSVLLPPLKEQDDLISIIKALDDRIENLSATSVTLEAIAQTLFKSWFVDFDPVRAKAEGRKPEGIDAETAALFPDSFEESELGFVPNGWKVASLGDVKSYLSRGISPKYIEKDGITVINQKCIRDNIIDLDKSRRHDPKQRKIEGRELLLGDILVNSTGVGTLGRVAQVLFVDEPLIVDSHVTVVRAGESLTWNYLGLALLKRQSEIEQLGEGSTGQTELSRSMLAGLKLVIPKSDVLSEFDLATLSLREKFVTNLKQIKTLAILRDLLLPRLISGQLQISELETLVEIS